MMPVCKRCLLADMDASAMYETVRRRIDQLPENQRADAETYSRRLEICRTCDALVSGLCSICGCFTELRAARAEQHCPHPAQFW